MIMELPKASRTVKRTIDLVHLFAASVWLGGFAVLFVLTLSDGAALGLASLDAPVAMMRFVRNSSCHVFRFLWQRQCYMAF